MRKLHLVSLICIAGIMLSAAPIAQFNGQITDKTKGWFFKPSKPNKKGMTYNEFEGYYPDKGGKLFSKKIKLDKKAGEAAYYRITFSAQANERSYQGINFYDAKGKLLPDCYDVLYKGDKRAYDRVFYAMDKVDSVEIFFQTTKGCQAWDVKLEKTTWEEAAKYCDRLYAELPPLKFEAPKDAMKNLPRTVEALKNGTPWRVVLLGDSIMQDTFHSQFHSLVKREFPKSNFNWIISMRGGTGCWHYVLAEHFKTYVFDEKPDLLIIGGISNFKNDCKPTGVEAMEQVARAARAYFNCEVLIMTGALAVDTRQYDPEKLDMPLPVQPWNMHQNEMISHSGWNFQRLKGMARGNKFGFFDMTTPSYQWLYATGKPREFYSRDAVHSGEKGKQIIGRIVLEHFKTAK